jgi:hypothetical protein
MQLCAASQESIMELNGRQTPANTASRDRGVEQEDERRKLRRLQILVGMVQSVLSQEPDLTPEKASHLIANCRQAALAMFPGKELAFDLIYRPRLERVVKERFPSL